MTWAWDAASGQWYDDGTGGPAGNSYQADPYADPRYGYGDPYGYGPADPYADPYGYGQPGYVDPYGYGQQQAQPYPPRQAPQQGQQGRRPPPGQQGQQGQWPPPGQQGQQGQWPAPPPGQQGQRPAPRGPGVPPERARSEVRAERGSRGRRSRRPSIFFPPPGRRVGGPLEF